MWCSVYAWHSLSLQAKSRVRHLTAEQNVSQSDQVQQEGRENCG
jgi:hypothetical protein